MRFLNLVSGPAVEPVALSDAKLAAMVDITAQDSLITGLIVSARQWCEGFCDRAFITQTYDLILDGFPYGGGYINRNVRENPTIFNWLPTHSGLIELPKPPVQSIVSITYLDSANVQQTLDPSVYRPLGGSESPTFVTTQPNMIWPVTYPMIGAATIRFTTGYGDSASDVPQSIIDAIKILVAKWYNDITMVQDGGVGDVPDGVKAILAPNVWGAN